MRLRLLLTFSVFLVVTGVPVVLMVTGQDCENGGGTGTEDLWLEIEEFIPMLKKCIQLMIWVRRWASQYLKCHTHLSSEENVVITGKCVKRTANMATQIIMKRVS
jgi:hypothetical protein